jgi:hypothetical protein
MQHGKCRSQLTRGSRCASKGSTTYALPMTYVVVWGLVLGL